MHISLFKNQALEFTLKNIKNIKRLDSDSPYIKYIKSTAICAECSIEFTEDDPAFNANPGRDFPRHKKCLMKVLISDLYTDLESAKSGKPPKFI